MDASQTSALVSPSFSPRLTNSALKGPSSNWALTLKQLKGRYLHIASKVSLTSVATPSSLQMLTHAPHHGLVPQYRLWCDTQHPAMPRLQVSITPFTAPSYSIQSVVDHLPVSPYYRPAGTILPHHISPPTPT